MQNQLICRLSNSHLFLGVRQSLGQAVIKLDVKRLRVNIGFEDTSAELPRSGLTWCLQEFKFTLDRTNIQICPHKKCSYSRLALRGWHERQFKNKTSPRAQERLVYWNVFSYSWVCFLLKAGGSENPIAFSLLALPEFRKPLGFD